MRIHDILLKLFVFFFFVIATIISLVLGHVAMEYHRRAVESKEHIQNNALCDAQPEPLCLGGNTFKAMVLVLSVVGTGVAILLGAFVTSFKMVSSGAIADLLLEPERKTIEYSLVTLGVFVTRGDPAPPLGLRTVQCIFFVFAFIIPLLLIIALLFLLVMPLPRDTQKLILNLCCVLDAWAAFDVFAIGVAVAHFEFGLLAQFLVYNDNIARVCGQVKRELEVGCLSIECRVLPGFALLAAGGLTSYFVPKAVFRFCREALDEEQLQDDNSCVEFDSEEENELLGTLL